MAKTLNQFLEGYLKVKNPDEQKFVDKHVVAKHSDRNGNDDEVFKGSKVKQIDRRKERHGYNPGEDEKVYEELKGNQHKIDANKNGKVDAHDFKLLRKKKKVAEEAELQEGDGTGTYSVNSKHKKHNELVKAGFKHQAFKHGDGKVMHTYWSPGYRNADLQKVLGEEAEQIDEISKATMGRYINRAKDQIDTTSYVQGHRDSRGSGGDVVGKGIERKLSKRHGGIELAVKKLAKEEVELDESAKIAAHLVKRYGDNVRKSHVMSAAKDFGVEPSKLAKAVRKKLGKTMLEDAEQIDELSRDTLRRYRMKAKAIGDNEKGDIGYRSKGRDLSARKTHGGQWGIPKAKVMAKEEVEDLDEAKKKLPSPGKPGWDEYVKNRNAKAKRWRDSMSKARTVDPRDPDTEYEKARHKAANPHMESVEQIDELSTNTIRNYLKKDKEVGDKLPHWGGRGYRPGRDPSAHHNAVATARSKLTGEPQEHRGKTDKDGYSQSKGHIKAKILSKEEVELDEKLTAKTPMGTYIKDFQKSDAPQFKGKSKEKRRVMAIAAKLTAERGGKPLRKEEKLANLLGDLTESHRRTMLSVFDKLNEDNQKKFLEACGTPEGVEQMLDFSISHRGE